jgi:hypothetical protein
MVAMAESTVRAPVVRADVAAPGGRVAASPRRSAGLTPAAPTDVPARGGESDSPATASTPIVAGVPSTTDAAPPEPASARTGPGKVRIRAFPTNAIIAIDGRELGSGVVLDSVVASGRRQLRVSAPGYLRLDTTIVVVAGETTQLPRLTLVPVETP